MPREKVKKPKSYVLHLGKPKISAKDVEKNANKDSESDIFTQMKGKIQRENTKRTK